MRDRVSPTSVSGSSHEQDCVAALVERAREGVPAAREELARRALRLALPTATAVLGSREEAGDVAQDAAVAVLRDLPRLREAERFDAWVHRIAVRTALRALRGRRLRARVERPFGELAEAEQPRGADPIEPSLARLALSPALARALQTLPARQCLAIVLRYVQDLSEQEVAEALGCRPGTAAALLSRARSRLREDTALRDLLEGDRS